MLATFSDWPCRRSGWTRVGRWDSTGSPWHCQGKRRNWGQGCCSCGCSMCHPDQVVTDPYEMALWNRGTQCAFVSVETELGWNGGRLKSTVLSCLITCRFSATTMRLSKQNRVTFVPIKKIIVGSSPKKLGGCKQNAGLDYPVLSKGGIRIPIPTIKWGAKESFPTIW